MKNRTYMKLLSSAAVLLAAGACSCKVETDMRIAFLGDSITNFGDTNPAGYVNLVMDGLLSDGITAEKIPAGVNGNDSNHMLARLDRDVISKKPGLMFLSCGVNDVWHQFDGTGGVKLKDYKLNIAAIIDQAQSAGIKVYVMTATPIGEDPASDKNIELKGYNDFLRKIARVKNCVLIDQNAAMWEKYKELKQANPECRGNLFTCDGLHLNQTGNIVMATEILRSFGFTQSKLDVLRKRWEISDFGVKKIMNIEFGLFDNMVMCRNENGISEQSFSGMTSENGDVYFSCGKSGKIKCGKAENGHFTGVVEGLKTGGPYDITLSVGKCSKTVKNILVGDVWILAGQSNMQGCGRLNEAFPNSDRSVRAYYMNDVWGYAKDPITVPGIANASVHWDIMGKKRPENPQYTDPLGKGAGLGVSFANEMFKITGIPQGVIACAHGGTKLEQWSPALKNKGDGSLYGAMLNRVKHNGGRVSGIIWYQGESDTTKEDALLFAKRMDLFVVSLREDLKNPALPFFQIQLARMIADNSPADKLWNKIREEQLRLGKRHEKLYTIPTIDLEMDDPIHITGRAQNLLGKRIADAVCTMRGMPGFLPQICPVSAKEIRINADIVKKIEIEFENVYGNLVSPDRPCGFSFNEKRTPEIIRAELKKNKVTLYVAAGLEVKTVSYGFGTNPFCNITDGRSRSLPAFTIPLESEFPKTPYASRMEISEAVLMNDDVSKLHYDDTLRGAFYEQKADGCWILPRDLKDTPHKPGFRFFKAQYDNPEKQRLKILIGYDAPAKVFCDGMEIHVNPDGTNPIIPDQYCVEVNWEKGVHEIVVAEAMHNGNAYGITLAIEGYKDTLENNLPTLSKKK